MNEHEYNELVKYVNSCLDPDEVEECWNKIGRNHDYSLPYNMDNALRDAVTDWFEANGGDYGLIEDDFYEIYTLDDLWNSIANINF